MTRYVGRHRKHACDGRAEHVDNGWTSELGDMSYWRCLSHCSRCGACPAREGCTR